VRTRNQVPEIVVAYPTTASDAAMQPAKQSTAIEAFSMKGIRTGSALIMPEGFENKSENGERNGHPETNAAPLLHQEM
jgi:hypothetical protein